MRLLGGTRTGIVLSLLAFIAMPALAPLAGAVESTQATPEESITLSPVNKRYQLDAGATKQDQMTIINDGKIGYDFIVYARPYGVTGETYNPTFTTTSSNADAYKWVQFEKSTYHLEPNQTVVVNFTVRVPANAAPGGHYGVLFAETQPSATPDATSVARKKRVGSILYATVKGTYQMGGESLGHSLSFLQFRTPDSTLKASSTIKNTGNADFIDAITFRVKDVFGNVKYEQAKESPVLPGTTRVIPLEWTNAPWFGLYNVEINSSFLDKQTKHSGYVLLTPPWLLGVFAVVIIGAVIYVARRRK